MTATTTCTPGRRSRHRPGEGFTLVELMVVISVIALLIAMLLPALQSARNVARRAMCGSNQRQVMIGLLTYSTDFAEWFPYTGYSTGNVVTEPPPEGTGAGDPLDDKGIWIPRYIGSGGVRLCPSADPRLLSTNNAYYRAWDSKGGAMTYRLMTGLGSWYDADPPHSFNGWYGWYYHVATSFTVGVDQPPCPRASWLGTTVKGPQNANVTFPAPSGMGGMVDLFNPTEGLQWLASFGSQSQYMTINHVGQQGLNVTFLDGHTQWRLADRVQPRLKFWTVPVGWGYEVWW